MGDILLSALLGSAQIQAVTTSASMGRSLPQLPPEIANLPAGSTLQGFVVNRDGQNNPILRTSLGDVLVKSEVFLKTGSEVVLRIGLQGGQANAQIISVDSVPLQTLIQQQNLAPGKADLVQPSTLAVNTNNPQPLPAPIVEGIVLKLAQFGNEATSQQTIASILRLPPGQIPQLEQGLTLQFRVAGGSTAGTQSAAAAPQLTTPASNTGQLTSTQYGAYSKLSANTAPPTSTPLPSEPVAPRPGTLTGTVIGQERGETIIRTSIGTIKLFTPSALPVGSSLQLELIAQPATSGSASASPVEQTTVQSRISIATQLAQEWDSLKEAHHLLREDSPAEAARFAARIPNTKSATVNNVLFFLSALRGNDLQRFFGQQSTQKIEDRSSKLFQRLSNDFNNLRVLATEQPDSNWQMMFFPLMHEDELQQARLFIRRDPRENQQEKQGEDTRFVLEVDLSEIGAIQIDGLMHGEAGKKLFDVTLRSLHPLKDEMQNDIRQIYHNAAEVAGFSGQVRFASGFGCLLQPLQEIRAEKAPEEGSILA